MNYLVHPIDLVSNSHRVNGFTKMVGDARIPQWSLLEIATEVVEEWSSEWDSEEGFGSSDMTFMMKNFIDNVIWRCAPGKLMTDFTPNLSVVPYSEAKHHERIQRMESGL